jgi:hypothetical protein
MDLIIRTTGTTDLTAAAVVSASDLTPLTAPQDLPQLTLGATEPVTVKFVSAASTYESWSGDATYAVMVTVGQVTADGTEGYAEATLDTTITNGKSGNLNLDTTALNDALALAFLRNKRANTVQLTLQVTVTDPTGNRRVWAMIPVTVWGKVSTYVPDSANNPPSLQPVLASRATGQLASPLALFDYVTSIKSPSGQNLTLEAGSGNKNVVLAPSGTVGSKLEGYVSLGTGVDGNGTYQPIRWGRGNGFWLLGGQDTFASTPDYVGGIGYNLRNVVDDVTLALGFEHRYNYTPSGDDSEFHFSWTGPDRTTLRRPMQINVSWGDVYGQAPATLPIGHTRVLFSADEFRVDGPLLLGASNISRAAWGTTGVQVAIPDRTHTDTSTTVGGTVAVATAVSIGQPTFAASNAITNSIAASLYIAGTPVAGTNVTNTLAYSLYTTGPIRTTSNLFVGADTTTGMLSASDKVFARGAGGSSASVLGTNLNFGANLTNNILGDVLHWGYGGSTSARLQGFQNGGGANYITFDFTQNAGSAWTTGLKIDNLNSAISSAFTTDSTSSTTGALTTAGGLGVAKSAFIGGSLTTGTPSGGTAGAWKLGIKVDATTSLDTAKYLQVDIGGTLYKVALVTS